MTIKFTIQIEPRPQKRDRIGSFGGHGRSYKAPEQAKYEGKVAAMIDIHRPERPLEGAIELQIVCYLPIPVSKTKRFKQAALSGYTRPVGKPDCTNMAKNVEDIMNGIFYHDDSQVVKLTVEKWYSDNPRWEIELTMEDFK